MEREENEHRKDLTLYLTSSKLRALNEENEHRKDLTPSEKVRLGMRIEAALAGRQGQRTDLMKPDELPQNLGEVKPGTESRDIAAKAVDMNRETYRQAKVVVQSGY